MLERRKQKDFSGGFVASYIQIVSCILSRSMATAAPR